MHIFWNMLKSCYNYCHRCSHMLTATLYTPWSLKIAMENQNHRIFQHVVVLQYSTNRRMIGKEMGDTAFWEPDQISIPTTVSGVQGFLVSHGFGGRSNSMEYPFKPIHSQAHPIKTQLYRHKMEHVFSGVTYPFLVILLYSLIISTSYAIYLYIFHTFKQSSSVQKQKNANYLHPVHRSYIIPIISQ